ncbi:MAG: FAD-dependent oxidoreductase, partial [Proteobacteria bacterium]|nr:FAD-dependent oxidoreductase [Pseudomonadota bacterium]
GKKVLIAGAGPAGLAAGYFLARLGYSCDVFEAKAEPGGILRWGIPRYRLPETVLKQEIDRIIDLGVNIYCNTPVSQLFLNEVGGRYDAVFLGCGYGRSLKLGIPGEKLALDGLEFLFNLRRDAGTAVKGTAAVIGGGNTAVDVARSLVRLGEETMLIYRRRKQDMPAFPKEVAMAAAEGVEIVELAAPIRIEADGRKMMLTLQHMKVSGMQTGRAQVVPDEKATRRLRADRIYTAIGAQAEASWQMPPGKNAAITRLSHCAFTTNDLPLVFGGDLTNSNKSVTDAIASGKQAAMVLDTFFDDGWEAVLQRLNKCRVGNGPALSMESYLGEERIVRNSHIVQYEAINLDYFSPAPRIAPPILAVDQHSRSFSEIEQTLTGDQVLQETGRCFNCGICNACENCRLFCPEVAVTLKDSRRQVNLDYCKGCGICVVECPRNAMALEEEI